MTASFRFSKTRQIGPFLAFLINFCSQCWMRLFLWFSNTVMKHHFLQCWACSTRDSEKGFSPKSFRYFESSRKFSSLTEHTIRKVKFLSKNSILTKPQQFHEFFTIFTGNQSWIFGQKMKISKSVLLQLRRFEEKKLELTRLKSCQNVCLWKGNDAMTLIFL